MKQLNVQRVQLPDGTCIKIEGGDARSTAHFIANNYLGMHPVTQQDDGVEPLPLPSTNFEPAPESSKPSSLFAGGVDDDVTPLELPSMNLMAEE